MPQHFATTIPVIWHVDGAEFHRNSEFYIWSWSNLLGFGDSDVWNVKFPFACIPQMCMRDSAARDLVMTEIMVVIAWSHRCMALGKMPAKGPRGEALQGARARTLVNALDTLAVPTFARQIQFGIDLKRFEIRWALNRHQTVDEILQNCKL
jgi:hypothetical protein